MNEGKDKTRFVYSDTDIFENEIGELYSYSERCDIMENKESFEEFMEDYGFPLKWKHMVPEQKSRACNNLISSLENYCKETRIKSCRALTYLLQGNFEECDTVEECFKCIKENVFTLTEMGIFTNLTQLLIMESDGSISDSERWKSKVSILADSSTLRLILSAMCTIVETMHHTDCSGDLKMKSTREQFIQDLQVPIGNETLIVILLKMLNSFCNGIANHFPTKKITLLIWKILLLTLGGSEYLHDLKNEKRKALNLPPVPDNTLRIIESMKPNLACNDAFNVKRFAGRRQKVIKQWAINNDSQSKENDISNNDFGEKKSNFEDSKESSLNERTAAFMLKISQINGLYDKDEEEVKSESNVSEPDPVSNTGQVADTGPVDLFSWEGMEPKENRIIAKSGKLTRRADIDKSTSLPWTPKVRKKDLLNHLSDLREKFLGFSLDDDVETTHGLPNPIIEGIGVIKKYLYISLADAQLEREEKLDRFPLYYKGTEINYEDAPAEKLYYTLLPKLPQYLISLLKILLAASTYSSKIRTDKSESIDILAEICSEKFQQYSSNFMDMKQLEAEDARHREIIIKSVSSILFLLLKHFKVNHIFQFEYVSQQLMFANCIPLILKILGQDINTTMMQPLSTEAATPFPINVMTSPTDMLKALGQSTSAPLWRNKFSCINLVRVLNKLVKWKNSRIMMLVLFKSSSTLVKIYNIENAMFQVYVLKLLKIQSKFLGKQWKKSNMQLLSAIYQRVRHRFTDDWAYSNDSEAKPWDFQSEEYTLQADINKFHERRYSKRLEQQMNRRPSYAPALVRQDKFDDEFIDNHSEDYELLNSNNELLTQPFMLNYEKWLNNEVFERQVDWDQLLEPTDSNVN